MVDAMCGSGTLLLEAALIAHKVAPGLLRTEWALLAWPDCDQDAWQAAWESARGECQLQWSGVIAGCDVHKVSLTFSSAHQHFRHDHHPAVELIGTCCQERAVLSTLPRARARVLRPLVVQNCSNARALQGALALASESILAANMRDSVRLRHGSCLGWKLPQAPDLVVTNPPWGARIGGGDDDAFEPQRSQHDDTGLAQGHKHGGREMGDLEATWRELQDFLKDQCGGAQLANVPQAMVVLGCCQ